VLVSERNSLPGRFLIISDGNQVVRISKYLLTACLSLLCLFVLPSLHAWQKSIHFDHITVEDGLPDNYVYSSVQDSRGFMWFGTHNGLAKYDGYRFTVYRHDLDDPESISSRLILNVFEDHLGTLWVGTNAGLDRFNREQETFTHFRHDPEDATSLGGPMVPTIYEDGEGVLWIGHWFAGLSRFDRATETFVRYKHDPDDITSLPPGTVFAMLEDRSGVFWVGTYAREGSPDLTRFDRKAQTFSRFFTCKSEQPHCPQPATEADRPPVPLVTSIFEDIKGIIWIGGHGLTRYDRRSNSYRRYANDPENSNSPAGNKFAQGMAEDESGRLWFTDTFQGLTSFDPATGTFIRYQHDPMDPNSISTNDLYGLYQDRDGIVWITSYFNGVNKFDPRGLVFGHYKSDSNDPNSLSGGHGINGIAEDNEGQLWVAFDRGGLNRVNRLTGSVTSFQHDPDNPGSLHTDGVLALHVTRAGDLWIGTTDGLSRFDPVTETFEAYPVDPVAVGPDELVFNDAGIISILDDREGFLWLGTHTAVHHYDPATGRVVHYRPNPEEPGSLHGDLFGVSLIADDDKVWIRSQSAGFNVFDPVTATFSHYVHDPKDPSGLPQGPVGKAWQDQQGVIWVGTMSGLGQLDPQSGVFSRFPGKGDFPEGSIIDIAPDGRGSLWIGTDSEGLWKLDPLSGEFKRYDSNDGLVGGRLGSGLLSHSGELIFMGNYHIMIFDPDALVERQQESTIVFTDFLLLNQSVPVSNFRQKTPLQRNINETTEITLTHRDYLFEFEFAALNNPNPMTTRYAYKLEGVDEEWIETDASKRFATYTMVPPGNYVLRVKASNLNGDWSEKISDIQITILPPWWRTWWAYSLYIIAFLLALFAYIRLRTIGLTRKAELLEKTVDERTTQIREHRKQIQHQADDLEELLHMKEKLIANISHEFRTPLTLISGPVKRMLQTTKSPENRSRLEMVRRNSERLLRLVDQLLGLARLGAEEPLTRSVQPLTTMARTITESFFVLAAEKDLKLTMEQGDELWVNCSPDALEKILLNLLSNAIKYTPAGGRITVSTSLNENGMAELSVQDTGVGIAEKDQQAVFERFHRVDDRGESVPGAGIGLALVKELVDANEGHISLQSALTEGSKFIVSLPYSQLAPGAETNTQAQVSTEAISLEIDALTQLDATAMPAIDEAANGKPCVLVVEDNMDMQNYLVEMLSDDYQCDVASDGQQAVETAFEHIPDLVLCDVMLPKMDGFQISHILKQDERTSHIPIIMLTALSDRASRLEGWKEHVDDYLTKPFDDEELKLRVANLLEIRDILKSRYSSQFFEENESGQAFNEKENGFLEKLERMLDENHADSGFDLSRMAMNMHMSTRQLQRKLKAITGHNPTEFLRSYRLKKARTLLKSGTQVGLAADRVGFSSLSYFTRCFKAQFAQTPTDYQQQFH